MLLEKKVDIKENDLLKIDSELLAILLKDKTTGNNIIWATDNYSQFGYSYSSDKEIKIELVTFRRGGIVKPRIKKSKTEQLKRVRQKAEVFTPCWICNMQNNKVDEEWFGRNAVFNVEKGTSWETRREKIIFPATNGKDWKDYVLSKRLEMCCGEAPYIASRYDVVTGDYIEVTDRIGILDRKLRIVSENTKTRKQWLNWAYKAVQNVYGFDWQGDNVLIARENLLFTVAEHYAEKFEEKLETRDLIRFAKVIVWNIWQMDGIRFVIPNSCCTKEIIDENLFEQRTIAKPCIGCAKGDNLKHNGIYCVIKDWETRRKIRFADMVLGGVK